MCYFKIIYKYILCSFPVEKNRLGVYEKRDINSRILHAFLNELFVVALSARREILGSENILAVGSYLASGAYRFCR